MNDSRRSTEYIFQGTMYFFRREKILCRYQFALQDAVEPALFAARTGGGAFGRTVLSGTAGAGKAELFSGAEPEPPVLCIRAVHSAISRRKRTAIFSA